MIYLRSSVFTLFLILFTVLFVIPGSPALLMGQAAARASGRFWCRGVLGGLRLICGVSYRLEGAQYICNRGAVVASNHQSMWETIALYALFPKPVMVLKKELLRVPFYGWWVMGSGNIVVDRSEGAKALRALTKAASAKIAAGSQVILFPEGTRSAPGERRDFQSGIAGIYKLAGAECIPVAHDSGRFWRHPGILKIPGEITIKILPPIAPGIDRKAFLPMLQARIEAARPDLAEGAPKNVRGADHRCARPANRP